MDSEYQTATPDILDRIGGQTDIGRVQPFGGTCQKHLIKYYSRDQLIAATRMHNEEVFDRSVDVLILRLRRKLEDDPPSQNWSKPSVVLAISSVSMSMWPTHDRNVIARVAIAWIVVEPPAPVNVSRRRYWRSLLRLSRLAGSRSDIRRRPDNAAQYDVEASG